MNAGKLPFVHLMVDAIVAMTGCAGARTEVVAPTATVPVSLSRAVRDAEGAIVGEDRREVLGQLEADGTAWGLLYSGIKLTPTMDVSQAVNQEVRRLHGDAVINVSIATTQCAWNWAPGVNLLPFWPGCANVHIHGDIIRVKTLPPPPIDAAVAKTTIAVAPRQGKRAHPASHKLAQRTP